MGGVVGGREAESEVRPSFLKKRSKKLLDGCRGSIRQRTQGKKFFGSFFQKRTASLPSNALRPGALSL
jgi:hypothetical protein